MRSAGDERGDGDIDRANEKSRRAASDERVLVAGEVEADEGAGGGGGGEGADLSPVADVVDDIIRSAATREGSDGREGAMWDRRRFFFSRVREMR